MNRVSRLWCDSCETGENLKEFHENLAYPNMRVCISRSRRCLTKAREKKTTRIKCVQNGILFATPRMRTRSEMKHFIPQSWVIYMDSVLYCMHDVNNSGECYAMTFTQQRHLMVSFSISLWLRRCCSVSLSPWLLPSTFFCFSSSNSDLFIWFAYISVEVSISCTQLYYRTHTHTRYSNVIT